MNKPINFFKDYMIKTYGEALYSIPLDMGTSCPNRDKNGKGGCSFCAEHGARSMQTMNSSDLDSQLTDAIKFAKKRYGAKQFLAYIQAFTASFNKDSLVYYETLLKKGFKAISFGTRPDCLDENAYEYLAKLNKKIDTWVELGVQTSNNKTLKRINRGHNWESSKKAIVKLNAIGIKVTAHIIIGLPGETREDFIKTASELSKLPINALKIHNLHVLEETVLGDEYKAAPFKTYMEHEYANILVELLRHVRKDIYIMRLTTDSLKDTLIAPKWNMNKSHFREFAIKKMIFEEIQQGDLCALREPQGAKKGNFDDYSTLDGSTTFWSEEFKEYFHSKVGARLEAEEKFLKPANITSKKVKLLDICFGLGYNSFVSIEHALKNNIALDITALEIDKRVVREASNHIKEDSSFNWNSALSSLHKSNNFEQEKCSINMLWGDARYNLSNLPDNNYDVIYLDAFSTQRNAELWTLDFFKELRRVITKDGVLLTYCAAIPVRHAMQLAGFHIGETDPVGRARGGTICSVNKKNILMPISKEEQKLFKTTRGLTYSDSYFVWPNKEILRNREFRIKEMK